MNMRTPPSLLDEEQGDSQQENAQLIEVDFSEYMWMGEELEEFDRQVEEELLEQAFIEACFEDMLEEEEIHWYYSQQGPQASHASPSPPTLYSHIPPGTHRDVMECRKDEMWKSSTLNPEAPEFVPKKSPMIQ